MQDLNLTIAGITIRFSAKSAGFVKRLRGRYGPFESAGDGKGWLAVVNTAGKDFFNSALQRSSVEFHTPERFIISGAHFSAGGDMRTKTIDVFIQESLVSFDGFLRVLMSLLLPAKKGFILHSAGVSIGGRGCLLPGKSESGKTTLYRKLGNKYVIGDELIAVHADKGGYWISSTPFWGNFRKGVVNKTCRLGAIFFLDKSRTKQGIAPITVSESIEGLLKVALCYTNDSVHAKQLLSNIISAVATVKSYQFKFNPDDSRGKILLYFSI